jgi:hypothetical protein
MRELRNAAQRLNAMLHGDLLGLAQSLKIGQRKLDRYVHCR